MSIDEAIERLQDAGVSAVISHVDSDDVRTVLAELKRLRAAVATSNERVHHLIGAQETIASNTRSRIATLRVSYNDFIDFERVEHCRRTVEDYQRNVAHAEARIVELRTLLIESSEGSQ
jgi:hypothetical protein